ncbi:preprotein translocase subunit SecB [Celerinatantimonas sp. MCCC 1A17872]|uniref:preprotein translocase subunit SecB n=1 Tax=Celerinatantimonas sp. MCCC 1A17872 TaxID=3177514 RepID=UPI0038CACBE4
MVKISKKLQKAIESLAINDVYQKESRSFCADDFDPKFFDLADTLQVQKMHVIHKSETVDVEGEGRLLRVFVRLGTRWVLPQEEKPDVKAAIESEFIAEYQIKESLDQDCIDEFALRNASYHVWPYWREYLSSQCERMRLPRVVLPTVQFSK